MRHADNYQNETITFFKGNGMLLVHYPKTSPRPRTENKIEIRLWQGQWFTDFQKKNLATRNQILR